MATEKHPIESNDIDEIFNNPLAKSIREAHLKNEFHPACSECKQRVDLGLTSDIDMFDAWYESAVENNVIDPNQPLDTTMPEPIWADIRPSNLCNLKCRMCYPDNSTEIAREWAELHSPDNNKILDHNYTTAELKQLSQRKHYELPDLNKVVNLKLLGGEPTVQKEVYNIIDKLEYNEHSKCDITTNATNPQQFNNIAPYLKKFAQVGWCVSIDGTEASYEYIRTPAKWDRFNEAVTQLMTKQYGRINTVVTFHFVLQAWNWSSVPDVLRYIDDMKNRYGDDTKEDYWGSLTIQPVDQPFLSLAAVPYEERERILDSVKKNFLGRWGELKKWSDSIPFDPIQNQQFHLYTALLDKKRGTKFESINPTFLV